MLLYTTMPVELVLEGMDKKYEFREIEIDNVKLLIEPIDINMGRIVRVFSTNPQDYLNPNFFPGRIIHFKI
ncbi:YlzJ-like family protein [Thermoanaerobacterium sp. DL9XJH110]|jgi:hypothetical protein|uniref:YlzJ-like family protein n=1 Tax=Thermoanaerobacterium sp. DL9XJH110 TaxID=3386643 RepID=UPI003BB49F69